MKKWIQEWNTIWKSKWYAAVLVLTAIAGYGFMITHQTIGIDDTPYTAYFEEGLAAIVGRWVTFLINKICHIADFAPFLTDFIGVFILLAAVTVWCTLWKRIFGERIPKYGYLLFACLFLSNPLICEVYTYYLHNGIAIGYLCCGIALCAFWEGIERSQKEKYSIQKGLAAWIVSAFSLWIALGCYESFMVVYLVGVCILLASVRMTEGKESRSIKNRKDIKSRKDKDSGIYKKTKIFRALCIAAVIAVIAIVLRSIMIMAVTAFFDLNELKDEAQQRSITEIVGWLFQENAFSEFAMGLKRVYVMYGVFAYAYYPIKIYIFASVIIGITALWKSIVERDGWIFVFVIGSFVASYLLVVIEGKATYYRSAQFLPLFSAWGWLILVYNIQEIAEFIGKYWKKRKDTIQKVSYAVIVFFLGTIIWNQCTEMNKWFYVDYLKYEDAKNTINQIAYQLEAKFDITKPIVFTGVYKLPESILADTYVPYNSPTFYKMKRLTDKIDENLLDKFYREEGVWVAQTPALSVIEWGRSAFGTDEELVRFFALHGHFIQPLKKDFQNRPLDENGRNSAYMEAEIISLEWSSFPAEDSIQDIGDYIIVHF